MTKIKPAQYKTHHKFKTRKKVVPSFYNNSLLIVVVCVCIEPYTNPQDSSKISSDILISPTYPMMSVMKMNI